MTSEPHIPVMLKEVMAHLIGPQGAEGRLYVDGTFGNGGYTRAILKNGGHVVAIDRDPSAISAGRILERASAGALTLAEGRFGDLDTICQALGHNQADGVVLDVGVSSMQLDQGERGFSFRLSGPLDMRMEQDGPSAADIVNTYSKSDLKRIIATLGEEKKAGYVAHAIVEARAKSPIATTDELAAIAEHAIGRKPGERLHPATRTFQALRIFVNQELEELARALFAAEKLLKAGGRLVVVAFHSLEDRIVKTFLKDRAKTHAGGSRHLPAAEVAPPTFRELTKRALLPDEPETVSNPRARSAKLRAAERLAGPAREANYDELRLPRLPELNAGGGRFRPVT
ncbi:MAG: 16S rRNA (cytosine(1402)-N(4))-methyltransferase RsmH [Pseudomonadota bacterium]